jgi:hypothetical protein
MRKELVNRSCPVRKNFELGCGCIVVGSLQVKGLSKFLTRTLSARHRSHCIFALKLDSRWFGAYLGSFFACFNADLFRIFLLRCLEFFIQLSIPFTLLGQHIRPLLVTFHPPVTKLERDPQNNAVPTTSPLCLHFE